MSQQDPAAMSQPVRDTPAISDQDVLDAMAAIPGYLDIGVEDFRTLYTLAQEHARLRVLAHIRAETLMRRDIEPVTPDTMLDVAARCMTRQGLKAVPVVTSGQRVHGMLTQTDFLHRLQARDFLHLMLSLMKSPAAFSHRCYETPVSAAMSSPAVTIRAGAGFHEISAAFQRCGGRSLPVTAADGTLLGLLLREDFVSACGPEQGT
jgi:CBS domain-containing membrane protein